MRGAGNLLFVLPFVAVYLGLMAYPLGYGVWMSLNDFDLLGDDTVRVGVKNVTDLIADPIVLCAVRNTVLLALMTLPGFVALGVRLALALNQRTRTAAVLSDVRTALPAVAVVTVR